MQLLEHFRELTLHPKNAEELKGLILQLAVQGKLTQKWREENPDVEPASVLLERIETKKRLLSNQKTIKSEGNDSFLSNEEQPFELPETWTWCRLGDITDLPYGKGLSQQEFTEQGYDVFGANGVIGKYSKYLYEEEQLLISCRGAYSGKTNISPKKCFVTSNSLVCDFFDRESTDYKFFFYAITALPKEKLVTGSAQPQVTATNALPLPIALPPVEEQKAIVEIVNQLFAEVEQLEALTKERIQLKEDFVTSALNQLTQAAESEVATHWELVKSQFGTFFTEKSSIKKLREAILQLAVQGKLTRAFRESYPELCEGSNSAAALLEKIKTEKELLIKAGKIKKEKPLPEISEEEVPYDLPEGWVWCRLGELVKFMAYGTSQKTNDNHNDVPVLRMGNITSDGELHFNNLKYIPANHPDLPKLYLEYGDLVFNRTNSFDLVGKSGVFKGDENSFTLASYLIKVSLHIDFVSPDYINKYIVSPVCRKSQIEPQITAQTNQANFSGSKLREVLVPLPALEEQKAIVEKVNVLMALCDQLEQEIETHQTTQEHWMQSCLREVV